MNKAYKRINWENYPSDVTPLNEANLNKLDSATDTLDDRVITLETTKATKTEVATLVADVTFEESTGIITITKKNGSKVTIDTQMEKIAVNFDYDPTTQQIILTLIDGTKQYIDLSALITQYEFLDTDTVAFIIGTDGKVSAIVKEGSVEEKHLEPNYLAKIKVESAKAQASQESAATSATNAASSATAAESYAIGGTGTRDGEDADNAKYYSEQAKSVYDEMQKGQVTGVKGATETEYRRGNVNLTPENIGAAPKYEIRYTNSEAGWRKIATVNRNPYYWNFDLYTTGNWASQQKSLAHFQIFCVNGYVRINQISGCIPAHGIKQLRLVRLDEKNKYILEEYSDESSGVEKYKFTIIGDVAVTTLDGSIDTNDDSAYEDIVTFTPKDLPTGYCINSGNIGSQSVASATKAEQDGDGNVITDTYLPKSSVVNNNTTTEEGLALDARQANPNVSGTLAEQISALNSSLVTLCAKFTQGIVSYSGIAASSYKDYDVTFDTDLASVPIVIASHNTNSTAPELICKVSLSAINITKNGFTLRIFNATTTTINGAVMWQAMC